ncbi:MAG: hypothetical protein CM1200mP22_17780 [Dehalococcoidia bacterium]|nr:MAG: hypothetical protein CM1200mP22_17780 [Dehalococcoidia bacterium]
MDLGMVGDRVENPSNELETVDFQDDEIVMVAAPDHPASNMQNPTVKQVAELGLVMREVGSATRQNG